MSGGKTATLRKIESLTFSIKLCKTNADKEKSTNLTKKSYFF